MKTYIPFVIGSLLAALPAVQADLRTSANYSIATDTTDSGGSRGTSGAGGNYTNSGSISTVTGTASANSPAETAKAGYIGQIFDVTGLQLNSASLTNTVNEGATLQLAAWQVLDDATFLAVPAASVAWSVVSGPLVSVNASGLATAEIVYEDTPATAQGIFGGFPPATLVLTVKNVNPDDLPGYANDGIDDKWQKDYFGLPPNPLAAPTADPDGDGQTYLFEFTAGVIRTIPPRASPSALSPSPASPRRRTSSSPRVPPTAPTPLPSKPPSTPRRGRRSPAASSPTTASSAPSPTPPQRARRSFTTSRSRSRRKVVRALVGQTVARRRVGRFAKGRRSWSSALLLLAAPGRLKSWTTLKSRPSLKRNVPLAKGCAPWDRRNGPFPAEECSAVAKGAFLLRRGTIRRRE